MATASLKATPFIPVELAEPGLKREDRPDGSIILSCTHPLPSYPDHVLVYLRRWAKDAPERPLLAERGPDGAWRHLTFGEAMAGAEAIGQDLLRRGLGPNRPVAILGPASIGFGRMKFAAMLAGVPFVPVSPAYSLMSKEFDKLRAAIEMTRPGMILVPAIAPFRNALGALDLADVTVVSETEDAPDWPGAVGLSALRATTPGAEIAASEAALGPDTVAKILLTSGSTGMPKGVINTHRMMTANSAAQDVLWPFLTRKPPILVDWLPWSHTFGSSFNFNQILRHGGTEYIDAGRPVPKLIETTVRNLAEVQPTLLYNVPRGYEMIVPFMERDEALNRRILERVDVIFYAGAGLSQDMWDRLEALSVKARGARIPLLSALGSTETAPAATMSHWGANVTGSIGLPVPGTELKLVPNMGKLELRVRGPIITPGYHNAPDLTAKAFDEEGFYLLGDAVKFHDPSRPEAGLIFDGRVSENFKLATGTWVSVGTLRLQAIAACSPAISDAVVCGHDADEVTLLVFPNFPACRQIAAAGEEVGPDRLVTHPAVHAFIREKLAAHNKEHPGSSTRIERVLLMTDPPSIDRNEITDKGYLNQRGILASRAGLVERLRAAAPGPDVVVVRAASAGGAAGASRVTSA